MTYLCVTVMTLVVGWSLIACLRKQEKPDATKIALKAIAASSIPTGLALIYCAYVPEYLEKLPCFEAYVAFAGLVVLLCSISTLMIEND